MAECNACHQDMLTAPGCTLATVRLGDEVYDRIKWRSLAENALLKFAPPLQYDPLGIIDRCHDCAALPGNFHHPGCDMERCPRCKRQAIGCACRNGAE